jgi:hypothetical protein
LRSLTCPFSPRQVVVSCAEPLVLGGVHDGQPGPRGTVLRIQLLFSRSGSVKRGRCWRPRR